MEKIPPKLPLRKEKVQSSCIRKLVDIFDFSSNGRSSQKLLSNGRRKVKKEIPDAEQLKEVHRIAGCSEKSFEVNLQHIYDELNLHQGGAGFAMHDADTDAFQEYIKNLMQEEFDTSKKSKKAHKKLLKSSDSELVGQLQDYHKKPDKHSKKANQVHIQQRKDKFLLGPGQSSCSDEISLDKHNLEAMCEEICSQIYQERIHEGDGQKIITPKQNELDQVNLQLLHITAKVFIDHIFVNPEHNFRDGVISKLQYFSDASEILNLNRDLFLKLVQDPNSLFLRSAKTLQFPQREKERMKLYLDARPSGCGSSARRHDGNPEDAMKIQKRNSDNPLWKKLKDRYGCSSKGDSTTEVSNRIVILKPRSKSKQNAENVCCLCSTLQAHQSSKKKGQHIKSTYFSFKEIKRKFKQAVGENQQKQHLVSMDESLRRLARKKHLLKDVEKNNSSASGEGESALSIAAKRRDNQPKLVDLHPRSRSAPSSGNLSKEFNRSTSSSSKQRQLDIFMEAKRHLSERLRNVYKGEIGPRKESPRTLKMILSSPEDSMITHISKRDKSTSVSAQKRFSPYNNIEMINANNLQSEKGKELELPCPLKHNEEVPSRDFINTDDQLEISEFTADKISKELHTDPDENIYSIKDDLEHFGSANILEGKEHALQRSLNISEVPYELNSVDNASTRQGTAIKYEECGYMESSDMAISVENHPLRPLLGSSRSLNIHELENLDTAKYKEEHASPVSVLEPFSPEYFSSPTSTVGRPDESTFQPRRIDFDDHPQILSPEHHKIRKSACMEVEESLHLYVRAVMEASEFNEIHSKGPSTQDVLYTCVADIMELHPDESYTELQLLFDCIHEVLLSIYESYSGYPPWLSFLRQNIGSLPLEKDVVDEVVKEVNSYLLPKMEQPTLDQLVGKDIAKSGSWLDLCLDIKDIVIEIAEDVLQDSIEEIIIEARI